MANKILINNTIKPYNKVIEIEGDKSLSIRWLLMASQAKGKSISTNILKSEDVLNAINCLKKLGVKIFLKKNKCEIIGLGINGYKYKKNVVLDAGNSGTFARLILGLLVHSKNKIKITGDKSLSRRDFLRVSSPLEKFGAKISTKNGGLPLTILGTNSPKSIRYNEFRGSAQCKSSVMLAALNTNGETYIKAKKSRNHTELLFKYLRMPIKIIKSSKFDYIKIKKTNSISSINYKIPSDISSAAFFIVLTTLVKNSSILIKNVNVNSSRIGLIKILKKMGAKIQLKNLRNYKGEKISDIYVKSSNSLRAINCPTSINSSAIDEFLIIFLVAAKAKGVSYFKNLSELNHKESPRLKWGSKILSSMGIKNVITNSSIKIYGNPDIFLDKRITIKNFLKDHRVFMTSVIASLSFGGTWVIHDKDSVKSSFPSFLKLVNLLKN